MWACESTVKFSTFIMRSQTPRTRRVCCCCFLSVPTTCRCHGYRPMLIVVAANDQQGAKPHKISTMCEARSQ